MDFTNEYAERYKKMSNAELMEILENHEHYQPAAVEIATAELGSRQLTEKEVQEATLLLEEKKQKKKTRQQEQAFIRNTIKNAGAKVYDTLNPVQETTATVEKLVRYISIVFFAIAVYQLFDDWNLLRLLLTGNLHMPFAYMIYLYPILMMFFGSILFWKRKQIGWLLLVFYSSHTLVLAVNLLYNAFVWLFGRNKFGFMRPSFTSGIISFAFYSAILYVLCKKDMKAIYRIDKQKTQIGIIGGGAVGLFFVYAEYFL